MGNAVRAQHRKRFGRYPITGDCNSFLALSEQDSRDVFGAAASYLDSSPGYGEKDFWVRLVLDPLFSQRPEGRPSLLFESGTSLFKALGLINLSAEDIELVVSRDGIGLGWERGPTVAS